MVRAFDRFMAGEITEAELRASLRSMTEDEASLLHDLVVLDAREAERPLPCDGGHG